MGGQGAEEVHRWRARERHLGRDCFYTSASRGAVRSLGWARTVDWLLVIAFLIPSPVPHGTAVALVAAATKTADILPTTVEAAALAHVAAKTAHHGAEAEEDGDDDERHVKVLHREGA